MGAEVSPERITRALVKVRPSVYRVEDGAGGPTITLLLTVSAAGRRNAAARIVAALGEHDLRLDADDPVGALAAEGSHVPVRSAG